MKRKLLLCVSILALLGACVLFVWPLFDKKDAPYTNALPDDATVIVEIKPMQLLNSIGFTEQEANGCFVASALDAMGIDANRPLYVFVQDRQYGLLAPLNDKEKFSEYLASFGQGISDEDDYKVTEIESLDVQLAWDESRVLLIYNENRLNAQESLRTLMDKTSAPDSTLNVISQYTQPVTALLSGRNINNVSTLRPYLSILPIDLSRFDFVGTLDAENNQITAELHVLTGDAELQNELNALSEYLNQVSGDALLQFGDDVDVCVGYNFNGPRIMSLITERLPELATLLPVVGTELGFDVNNLFDSVVGDLTVVANNISAMDPNVYAEIKVSIASLIPIHIEQYGINVETRDDRVVLTYGDDMMNTIPGSSMINLRDMVRDSYGYIYISKNIIPEEYQALRRVAGVNSLLIRLESATDLTITLDMNNNLRDMVSLVSRIANNFH